MHRLPWIDGFSALTVGVLVLVLHRFLAPLWGLPVELVLVMGAVNALYCVPGFTIGLLKRRRPALLTLLIAANLFWAVVCVALLIRYGAEARPLGIMQIAGEGIYVILLAALEWRHRARILGNHG